MSRQEVIIQQERFSPELAEALFGVAGQKLNAELDASLDKFFDGVAGRAVIRVRDGSSSAKKVRTVVAEALTGEGTYVRPNGETYTSRKWGNTEHADIEVIRKSRDAKKYVLLYGAPGTGKTAMLEAAFGEEQLASQVAALDKQIEDQINPPVLKPPLPWNQAAE